MFRQIQAVRHAPLLRELLQLLGKRFEDVEVRDRASLYFALLSNLSSNRYFIIVFCFCLSGIERIENRIKEVLAPPVAPEQAEQLAVFYLQFVTKKNYFFIILFFLFI